PGRDAARQAIRDSLGARRGGRKAIGGQRVTFTITTRDGKTIVLGRKGGYDPKTVARQVDDFGGDPLDWIADQTDGLGDGQGRADGDTDIYAIAAGNIAAVSMSFV
ncbi:MAG TPA: hypothetical protein VMV41_00060, partial [Cellulomonadaceae bacterium]|nr:hypothetical protein [Cellulomonadaceae bacterium]